MKSKKSEGIEGIKILGHREYVGGLWEELGSMQLNLLKEAGLKPKNCLLDIACGCLRGGVKFINYLDNGNYLGLDKEAKLIELGVSEELGRNIYQLKQPEFIVSDSFEFERFTKKPDYSIAQSLFTHLRPIDIQKCLSNLRSFVDSGHQCFATYFEGCSSTNPQFSHSHDVFKYTPLEMKQFAKKHDWDCKNIGDWNHPRNQKLFLYTAK